MQKSPERVMVFKPTVQITVASPEQLAASGIKVHPKVIESTWGITALERYRKAVTQPAVTTSKHPDIWPGKWYGPGADEKNRNGY
ncbi:hypothetical protein HYS92_03125 [Candidatus Daviesbacteria bacterium]|nr:hypothetical protein [Candidatus Daviesbacteria bacterium]